MQQPWFDTLSHIGMTNEEIEVANTSVVGTPLKELGSERRASTDF